MKSIKTLEGISDGKIYDINDMVKADAGGCDGCSACCHGVGDLVELTPFDVYEIKKHLNMSFEELLNDKIQLREEKKIHLPHLKMQGDTDRCAFLNDDDRCSIHGHRPSICRLFPLGRVYDDGDFKYFLQVGACTKPKLGKIKVKKWIGIQNYKDNKAFILAWHDFIKALHFRMKFIRDEKELSQVNTYLIDQFFKINTDGGSDFHTDFAKALKEAKDKLGII